ncbi:porin [Alteromonas gilva]|uniref:Porin n=1 Tax=Alteromonas gilva TaxID=2987522 RepID=A0ABT5KWQ3_9ALTE|nr:porin [Alteromonas gilva]MDC8829190.1 porin [Alteromonas gilva]
MKKQTILAALALSTVPLSAGAEINFSGFGSVVGGVALDDEVTVRRYSDDIEFKQGSFFALQAYSDLTEGLSATVQLRARGSDDWEPDFTWAYLSYEIDPSWRIQAGRQRIPFYLYSDYLDVSYAYHWISPPSEVYKAPFDSIDGIATIHNFSVGDALVDMRLYFGQEDFETTTNSFEISNIISAVASVNYGWWTFKTSYTQFDITGELGLEPLVQAWSNSPFPLVGSDLDVNEDEYSGLEVGVIYDNQDWLFLAEYIPSSLDKGVIGDYGPWMISVGKRFGSTMFHATVGEDKVDAYNENFKNVPRGLDAGLDALIGATQDVIDSNTYTRPFYSVGMRWDFHPSVAFKVEYTNIDYENLGNQGVIQTALVTVF